MSPTSSTAEALGGGTCAIGATYRESVQQDVQQDERHDWARVAAECDERAEEHARRASEAKRRASEASDEAVRCLTQGGPDDVALLRAREAAREADQQAQAAQRESVLATEQARRALGAKSNASAKVSTNCESEAGRGHG